MWSRGPRSCAHTFRHQTQVSFGFDLSAGWLVSCGDIRNYRFLSHCASSQVWLKPKPKGKLTEAYGGGGRPARPQGLQAVGRGGTGRGGRSRSLSPHVSSSKNRVRVRSVGECATSSCVQCKLFGQQEVLTEGQCAALAGPARPGLSGACRGSVTQGQLPPIGDRDDPRMEEVFRAPSMDPRVDTAEPRIMLDGRVSPEPEHGVSRGQGRRSRAPVLYRALCGAGGPWERGRRWRQG